MENDNDTKTIQLGGPTIFAQGADMLWGEYELPENLRIENGDQCKLDDCKFLGVYYRELPAPDWNAASNAEEKEKILKEWRSQINREDARVTFDGRMFITLIPVE